MAVIEYETLLGECNQPNLLLTVLVYLVSEHSHLNCRALLLLRGRQQLVINLDEVQMFTFL